MKRSREDELHSASDLGDAVGIDVNELGAVMLLETVRGLGPQKFRAVHDAGVSVREVLDRPELLPVTGKRGEDLKRGISELGEDAADQALLRAAHQILRAREHGATILTYRHPDYPPLLRRSNTPVPILYARGDLGVLQDPKTVAAVGARAIRSPYAEDLRWFVESAVRDDFTIVSGFATGADTIAHVAAMDEQGRTLIVMPSGLDRPFPPENRDLWDQLKDRPGAVFVSESPFGTAASTLTLRKRNKLIVALSRGVLVGQSSADGGAMNAFRFAREQKKPVATFLSDGSPETSGNQQIEWAKNLSDAVFPPSPSSSGSEAQEHIHAWLSAL
jgi:DNA protecting protein DprA